MAVVVAIPRRHSYNRAGSGLFFTGLPIVETRRNVVTNYCKKVCALLLISAATTIASSAQTFSTLVTFNGMNGQYPNSLIEGKDGNLWGTTGFKTCGTVYKMSPAGAFTTVYSFSCDLQQFPDGPWPGALLQGTDGNFYGRTFFGGTNNNGSIFKLTPSGGYNTLVDFDGTNGEGPNGFVEGTDGNFYGTTHGGGGEGPYYYGTSFKVTLAGDLTTLFVFGGLNNTAPALVYASPTEAKNGNFFGVTCGGGVYNAGAFYEITPEGSVTLLYSFGARTGQLSCPTQLLTLGQDGNFYSTTDQTGPSLYGSIYRITPQGVLTDLHDFSGPDGEGPGPLVLEPNGSFYGTTASGGPHGNGTIFSVTPGGKVTTIYSLTSADGVNPASLVRGPDGELYGITQGAGSSLGTIFVLKIVDFSIAANPKSLTVSAPGGEDMTTLTVTPIGGFDAPLTYTCSGLPTEATCTFAAGTAKGTETLTVQTTSASARLEQFRWKSAGGLYALIAPGLLGLLVFPRRRRGHRAAWRLVLTFVLALIVLGMLSCGGGAEGSPSSPGTPTGNSTVTVTAATADHVLSHSLTVTLAVQ